MILEERVRVLLISDEKKFVFIHVTKTGGTTINQILSPYALPRRHSVTGSALRLLGLPNDYRKFSFPKHAGLKLAQKKLPTEKYAEYTKCAFVRNPWDRLVSEYSALMQKPHHRRYSRVSRGGFKHYVMDGEAIRKVSIQADQLSDNTGRIGVDFLGRFECLGKDISELLEILEIPTPGDLPISNTSKHGDYRDMFDEESRDFVAHHWRRDLEKFDYGFD